MIWWFVIGAFAASVLVTGAVRARALQLKLLDIPNERSSHAIPTPRGGGIAIVVVTLVSLGSLWALGLLGPHAVIGIGGAGAGLALVGLLDDRFGVPSGIRLVVHLVSAIWFAAWCSDLLHNLDPSPPGPILASLSDALEKSPSFGPAHNRALGPGR